MLMLEASVGVHESTHLLPLPLPLPYPYPNPKPSPKPNQASVGVDESTYLPMLSVAQRRGDWREAIELLVHAKEIKCETGERSYNLTLTACANAREERACR